MHVVSRRGFRPVPQEHFDGLGLEPRLGHSSRSCVSQKLSSRGRIADACVAKCLLPDCRDRAGCREWSLRYNRPDEHNVCPDLGALMLDVVEQCIAYRLRKRERNPASPLAADSNQPVLPIDISHSELQNITAPQADLDEEEQDRGIPPGVPALNASKHSIHLVAREYCWRRISGRLSNRRNRMHELRWALSCRDRVSHVRADTDYKNAKALRRAISCELKHRVAEILRCVFRRIRSELLGDFLDLGAVSVCGSFRKAAVLLEPLQALLNTFISNPVRSNSALLGPLLHEAEKVSRVLDALAHSNSIAGFETRASDSMAGEGREIFQAQLVHTHPLTTCPDRQVPCICQHRVAVVPFVTIAMKRCCEGFKFLGRRPTSHARQRSPFSVEFVQQIALLPTRQIPHHHQCEFDDVQQETSVVRKRSTSSQPQVPQCGPLVMLIWNHQGCINPAERRESRCIQPGLCITQGTA